MTLATNIWKTLFTGAIVMTKKALIISWHFPPYKSSSGFNLFKRFKDSGYEYDVIQREREGAEDNLLMFRYASNRINRYEISVPTEDPRDLDNREMFISKACEFVNLLLKENHYQVVISHSHEIVSHLAALAVKREHPELSWIASFGDPISANPFNDSYKFPLLNEDARSELEVLKTADKVVVTNSYQKRLVMSSVAEQVDVDKFFILPHCYEPRMYRGSKKKAEGAAFRFLHVGMLYKHKRTAEPFVLAAQKLLEKYPALKGCFTVEFFGANDRFIQEASQGDLKGVVSYQGNVSYLDSLSLMVDADCLLLRDADFSDQGLLYTPFYPGKLADYLGAEVPILAVTMEKGCVPDMFEELGYPYCSERDVEGIADEMYRAITQGTRVNTQEARKYSCKHVGLLAEQLMDNLSSKKTILFAGHDLKFLKDVIKSYEDDPEFEVLIDQWKNHADHNEALSREYLDKADIIFCEWGLGNIQWYANHKKRGQRLLVRIHLQENQRPEFLRNANIDNIDYFIFIAPYRYEEFIEMHGIPRHKAKMIFNTVDVEKFYRAKLPEAKFTLGFIGMVPWRKRFDRALDIFQKLWQEDNRYVLRVKGLRPRDYPWMLSKSRKEEMAQYDELYKRIENAPWKKHVIFDGHGSDMPEWFQRIGYIISTSDFEGSHQAVAEGMASGSVPIIYGWDGADTVYPKKYTYSNFADEFQLVGSIKSNRSEVMSYARENFCHLRVIAKIRDLCEESV
jgi:glycosyltransferase involved in cell wall biosynthesis